MAILKKKDSTNSRTKKSTPNKPPVVENVTFSIRHRPSSRRTSTRDKNNTYYQATPFSWRLWSKSKYDELSHSLFLAPSLAVLAGIVCAVLLTLLDKYLSNREEYVVPAILTTTVESARTVLGTVAGATISFAGIAFSVSLLVIQLGASQLSPRVVHTLFKDRFNKNVMALVVGTFTYCLVVLRSVRHEVVLSTTIDEEGNEVRDAMPAIVPNLSVAIAVILGILSILATVAFIDHSAHAMDVSQILERVTRDTVKQIEKCWVEVANMTTVQVEIGQDGQVSMTNSTDVQDLQYQEKGEEYYNKLSRTNVREDTQFDNEYVVRFRRSGWVQEIDLAEVVTLVPPRGRIQFHTIEGRYAIPGTAICTISWSEAEVMKMIYEETGKTVTNKVANEAGSTDNSHELDDGDEDLVNDWLDELEAEIRNCIHIGVSRTLRLDPAYGLRELVDVTLRALSPGVNDPTTAQDGIFHSAAGTCLDEEYYCCLLPTCDLSLSDDCVSHF